MGRMLKELNLSPLAERWKLELLTTFYRLLRAISQPCLPMMPSHTGRQKPQKNPRRRTTFKRPRKAVFGCKGMLKIDPIMKVLCIT